MPAERVQYALRELTATITLHDLFTKDRIGFDAETVGRRVGISRANASHALNELWRAGRVVRFAGRPVLFVDRETVERLLNVSLSEDQLEVGHCHELLPDSLRSPPDTPLLRSDGPSSFDELVGLSPSLRSQVEQAKAAVLYPPRGLPTLITGDTGVGKTLFAWLMYRFAVGAGALAPGAPFITFNCADYVHNPQLLLSQLFGYVRGAFTGAVSDRAGVVEHANGGFLFLDEVHRLPPEGQEMLFQVMDRGAFARMGEVRRERQVQVHLVCATTEDPHRTMLRSFLRRVPVIIRIPALHERSLFERLQLIEYLLKQESRRIGTVVYVPSETLYAFLLYDCAGNVGQLQMDLRLACAQAYLRLMTRASARVELKVSCLPSHVTAGLLDLPQRRRELEATVGPYEAGLEVMPDGARPFRWGDTVYDHIEQKVTYLREEGFDQDRITELVSTDIKMLIRWYTGWLADVQPTSETELHKMVGPEMAQVARQVVRLAQEHGLAVADAFSTALALHVSAAVQRLRAGLPITNPRLPLIQREMPREYAVAQIALELLSRQLNVSFPPDEAGFLAMLLQTASQRVESPGRRRVGVVVVCHGRSTATSMAEVANKLLRTWHAKAFDMPLEVEPDAVLDQVAGLVKSVDQGAGVLLLVDMGSLVSFGQLIQQRTGIQVETIDMVTTAMVLEAVHKATSGNLSLAEVARAVRDSSRFVGCGAGAPVSRPAEGDRPTVLAVCASGHGAAQALQEMIEKRIPGAAGRVLPCGYHQIIQGEVCPEEVGNVVAVVGLLDPHLPGIPFISVDDLLTGSGILRLTQLLERGTAHSDLETSVDGWSRQTLVQHALEFLREHLQSVEPWEVVTAVYSTLEDLEERLGRRMDNRLLLRMLVHTACMLDRLRHGPPVPHADAEENLARHPDVAQAVRTSMTPLAHAFGVSIADDEIAYLVDILGELRSRQSTS